MHKSVCVESRRRRGKKRGQRDDKDDQEIEKRLGVSGRNLIPRDTSFPSRFSVLNAIHSRDTSSSLSPCSPLVICVEVGLYTA